MFVAEEHDDGAASAYNHHHAGDDPGGEKMLEDGFRGVEEVERGGRGEGGGRDLKE